MAKDANLSKKPIKVDRSSIAIAMAVIFFGIFISEGLPIIIAALRKEMGITIGQAGLIRFIPATVGLVITPLTGLLIDQLGIKKILTASLYSIGLGTLIVAASASLNTLVLGLAILGIGHMASWVSCYSFITKNALNATQLGLLLSGIGITTNFGYIAFPPIIS